MKSKCRKTLEAVFSQPTRSNIKWADIEKLFEAVGALVLEGDGSRVRIIKDTTKLATHRPHPGKEAKPYQVEAAREFLLALGVTP
ncbi:MAG: type II toxin-antitoxin system HicA family toxin [Deltaproteobacteria bacterium]|jgi:hypothetical protein|nr:type II toxin-antitoxin system HicA family toxin [Deltaproteobacteria bacterium]